MNRLRIPRATRISIDDFLAACHREVYVPIPQERVREITAALGDVEFRRFEAYSRDLLDSRLFAASDTDQARSRWFDASDDVPFAERRLIMYAELMELPVLLDSYLARLRADRATRPERSEPRMMTLHCSSCDARWMLDGNHGFARLCASGDHQPVVVIEMTSPRLGMRGCRCGDAR